METGSPFLLNPEGLVGIRPLRWDLLQLSNDAPSLVMPHALGTDCDLVREDWKVHPWWCDRRGGLLPFQALKDINPQLCGSVRLNYREGFCCHTPCSFPSISDLDAAGS